MRLGCTMSDGKTVRDRRGGRWGVIDVLETGLLVKMRRDDRMSLLDLLGLNFLRSGSVILIIVVTILLIVVIGALGFVWWTKLSFVKKTDVSQTDCHQTVRWFNLHIGTVQVIEACQTKSTDAASCCGRK